MNIGILVAVEFDAFFKKYGKEKERFRHGFFDVLHYEIKNKDIYVILSNAGQIRAAMAMTILLETYKCEMVLNFGVVGALRDQKLSDVAIVSEVVHYEFDVSVENRPVGKYDIFDEVQIPMKSNLVELASKIHPEIPLVKLASGDKFVEGKEKKSKLREEFGADIVDMEGAAIAIASYAYDVPCLMIKSVSDGLEDSFLHFVENLNRASEEALEIMDKIIEEI